MKLTLLPAFLLLQTVSAASRESPATHLRVQRDVLVPPGAGGQTCAVLDAEVYAHAESESLNDVRLFAPGSPTEIPFILTESNTERTETESATVRNLIREGDDIAFDLDMPKRAYTAVELILEARDFIGSATVSTRGNAGHPMMLGEFPVFDLSGQGLSRFTTLPLQEATFPELHVRLRLHPALGAPEHRFPSSIVTGATVPPSRAAQTLYTTIAQTSTWRQSGRNSAASLRLPAHVPVARVQVLLDPAYKANFLRRVTLSAKPDEAETEDTPAAGIDTVSGEISQLHLDPEQSGLAAKLPIDSLQTGMDAVLAANLRGGATVDVTVQNGSDVPLPLRAVELQMRQRRICFDAAAGISSYTLMYGDKELPAPVSDYSHSFLPSAAPAEAMLGPEQPNPQFAPRSDTRTFTGRHPELSWLALFATLAAFGSIVLRSLRHQRGASH